MTTNVNIQAIQSAAQAVIANKSQVDNLKEQGKGHVTRLAVAYLNALKENDKEALDFVENRVWKKGDSQGEYYAIRGTFSKARTIHQAGLDVTENDTFGGVYEAAQKKNKENLANDPKAQEKLAAEAYRKANNMDARQFNALTLAEQMQAVTEGRAILESQTKADSPFTFDEEMLLEGMLQLVDLAPEMAEEIIKQVSAKLASVAKAA